MGLRSNSYMESVLIPSKKKTLKAKLYSTLQLLSLWDFRIILNNLFINMTSLNIYYSPVFK